MPAPGVVDTDTVSLPLPLLMIGNRAKLLCDGVAGEYACPVTSSDPLNPTTTVSTAVTGVYVFPFTSVNDTVALFPIFVPSGVGLCACAASGTANITASTLSRVRNLRLILFLVEQG